VIHEESKKAVGVYVRHEMVFNIPNFSFLCGLHTNVVQLHGSDL
jgi:hypothetical protein